MRLVTIANITLNRPGTLTRSGFPSRVSDGSDPRRIFHVVVKSNESDDVLEKVKALAVQNGESADAVERLRLANSYGPQNGIICFNEPPVVYSGTQYGQMYAECEVFPAVEIEGRFFRLAEVICS